MPTWFFPLATFVMSVVVPLGGMVLLFERRLSRVETKLETVHGDLSAIRTKLGEL